MLPVADVGRIDLPVPYPLRRSEREETDVCADVQDVHSRSENTGKCTVEIRFVDARVMPAIWRAELTVEDELLTIDVRGEAAPAQSSECLAPHGIYDRPERSIPKKCRAAELRAQEMKIRECHFIAAAHTVSVEIPSL